MVKSLESEKSSMVLNTLATSTGTLHIAPFNFGDSPFSMKLIFLKRRPLAISTFSSLQHVGDETPEAYCKQFDMTHAIF